MLPKVENWVRYFYDVPWCVPQWGWPECFATAKCMVANNTVRGPYPLEAADSIRSYLGVQYALPVNRGRTAIELALRAMDLGKHDEVILPAYLCRSVLDAVLRAGACPVFADVGPTLNVTTQTVQAAITSKTRCVVVPHLFGKVAPIDKIELMLKGSGIMVIDDAAQAFGARCSGRPVGTFGVCGIVSLGPGKPLVGAAGGLLVTNDHEWYERAAAIPLEHEDPTVVTRRLLSFWAWRRFRRFTLPFQVLLDRVVGPVKVPRHRTCTMSNVDGTIALAQFRAWERNAVRRRKNAIAMLSALGEFAKHSIVDLSPSSVPVKLVLILPEKRPRVGEMINLLARAGIECQGGYIPLHLLWNNGKQASLPSTDALWDRVVCVPIEYQVKQSRRLQIEIPNQAAA